MLTLVKMWTFFLVFISSALYVNSSIKFNFDSLVGKNTPQIIEHLGYPYESHAIRTIDGVLLQYFRIPFGKYSHKARKGQRIPVLLVHALICSSYQWFLQVEDRNLPLLLADAGYDVWLANGRGVSYSTRLQNITTKDTAYWDFSFHEMGLYDLPAAIDYILAITKHQKLFYMGHSQGNTQLFVLLSMKPEYNAKIRLAMMMSPVAYMKDVRGATKPIAYSLYQPIVAQQGPSILTSIGLGEFFLSKLLNSFHSIAPFICTVEPIQTLCVTVYFLFLGFDYPQFQQRKWANAVSGLPDTTSISSVAHYAQMIVSKKFQRYDHGSIKNLQEYGQLEPPSYNLSRVTAPTAVYWSFNDYFVTPKAIRQLVTEVPNIILTYNIPNPKFNHFDYMIARDAYSLAYKPIIRLMATYS